MKISQTITGILLILGTTPVAAANITWLAPQDETGNASDVDVAGSLHAAVSAAGGTVNGVTFTAWSSFEGGSVLYGTEPVTVSGLDFAAAYFGGTSAPPDWDDGYKMLTSLSAFADSGDSATITISGLTAGRTYTVQIFEGFWDHNWATAFTGGDQESGLVNMAGDDFGWGYAAVPQYLKGSFVADGATQTIIMDSPSDYSMFAGLQVREIAEPVPEPASWAIMTFGFGLTGLALRRRRPGMRLQPPA